MVNRPNMSIKKTVYPYRAYNLISKIPKVYKELQYIRKILNGNGYPDKSITVPQKLSKALKNNNFKVISYKYSNILSHISCSHHDCKCVYIGETKSKSETI
ncbi:hypothetical protein B4U80_00081 [Leptotrombidium deliense]|uniref:Uncharacterized protein n=1 Tax=Leptotrombidium deliense TaxID=299467 RepID=A0A443RWZ6_9ACAR|nr:hypothetical protein B4U80_00081 [Leptotrombidium deliense]